jgi:hypothetical protein
MDHILANTKAYTHVFRGHLAERLEKHFALDRNFPEAKFEIAGTDPALIKEFSKGLARVTAEAGTSRRSLETERANDRTRPAKEKITVQERDALWQSALAATGHSLPTSSREAERNAGREPGTGATSNPRYPVDAPSREARPVPEIKFQKSLDRSAYYWALREGPDPLPQLTARALAESLQRHDAKDPLHSRISIEAMAFTRTEGQVPFADIARGMDRLVAKGLVMDGGAPGRGQVTTAVVLGMERGLVAALESGRNAVMPMQTSFGAEARITKAEKTLAKQGAPLTLTSEQRAFVVKALTTPDRTFALIGQAGTGKTTALKVLDAAIGRTQLWVASPSNELKNAAIKDGLRGVTHAWLDKRISDVTMGGKAPSPTLKKQFRGSVIVIDEASLAGTDQLARFAQFANRVGARLILLGDKEQIESPRHGGGMGIATRHLDTVQLTTVQRVQHSTDRALFAAARAHNAKTILEALGAERVRDAVRPVDLLRALYADALDRQGDKGPLNIALPVATNEARRSLNELARDVRMERGELGPVLLDRLMAFDKGINEADRAIASTYKPGDLLMVTGKDGIKLDGRTYRAYDRLTVTEMNTAAGTITLSDGTRAFTVRPGQPGFTDATNLFAERHREIRMGEAITFEISDPAKGVNRGAATMLKAADPTHLHFENARGDRLSLKRDDPVLGHLDHGYATTSNRLQGTSYRQVILPLTEHLKTTTAKAKQIYVMISRVLGRDPSKLADIALVSENAEQQVKDATSRRQHAPTGADSLDRASRTAQMQSSPVRDLTPDQTGRSTFQKLIDGVLGKDPLAKTGLDAPAPGLAVGGQPIDPENNRYDRLLEKAREVAEAIRANGAEADREAARFQSPYQRGERMGPALLAEADRSFNDRGMEMGSPALGKEKGRDRGYDLPDL